MNKKEELLNAILKVTNNGQSSEDKKRLTCAKAFELAKKYDVEIIERETTEIKVFKRLVEKQDALRTFGKIRKKKFLGLLGDDEKLESVSLKYIPVYKVRYNYFDSKNIYSIGQAYINSYTGEFLHFKNKSSLA